MYVRWRSGIKSWILIEGAGGDGENGSHPSVIALSACERVSVGESANWVSVTLLNIRVRISSVRDFVMVSGLIGIASLSLVTMRWRWVMGNGS